MLIFLLASLVLCASCISTKLMTSPERKITGINVQALQGQFENEDKELYLNGHDYSFWEQLIPFYRDTLKDWKHAYIQININDKLIHFSLIVDEISINQEKFKYKLENGFLVFKNNRLQGVPLIFYRFQNRKIYIALDKENNITVHVRGSVTGGILFIWFGSDTDRNCKFQRQIISKELNSIN